MTGTAQPGCFAWIAVALACHFEKKSVGAGAGVDAVCAKAEKPVNMVASTKKLEMDFIE
jgi:hypothetical protein